MPRRMDTSTKTQMAKIMVQRGRSSRSCWSKSVWSSSGMTIMGQAIRESSFGTRLGESFQLGMLIRTPWKSVILICVFGWHQIGWEDDPMWKIHDKELDSGEPTSFLGHVYWCCTQRECETMKEIVDNYRNMFESRIPAGAEEKLPCSENLTQTFPLGPLTLKVMQRNVWSDIASWRTNKPATVQSYNFVPWWPSIQRRRIGICWRIVKNMLSDCPEILILGTYWNTWISLVN